LNVSASVGDTEANVYKNMAKIKKSAGFENFWAPDQTHGSSVAVIDTAPPAEPVEADAVITCVSNLMVAVRTADCLPVLLADPKRKIAGAVHAGRGGTQLGIVSETIKKMAERFDCDPVDIRAGLGPCIRSCCYEVDEESAKKFHDCCGGAGDRYIDIVEANVNQLERAGLSKENIYDGGVCTSCENAEFFSYRADNGVTGRFFSGISFRGSLDKVGWTPRLCHFVIPARAPESLRPRLKGRGDIVSGSVSGAPWWADRRPG